MAKLIIRDRVTGRVKVDLSSRITKRLGVFSTGTSAGSIVVPGFSDGTPWWAWLVEYDFINFPFPTITIVGNTLSWTKPRVNIPITIQYGIY